MENKRFVLNNEEENCLLWTLDSYSDNLLQEVHAVEREIGEYEAALSQLKKGLEEKKVAKRRLLKTMKNLTGIYNACSRYYKRSKYENRSSLL